MSTRREEELLRELPVEGLSADATDGLVKAVRVLDRAADAERERLLAEGRDEELERRALAALEHELRPHRSWRGGLWLGLVAAAAAVALVAFWPQQGNGSRPDGGTFPLDASGGLQLLAPTGRVEHITRFEWGGVLPAGGHWELRVFDAEAGPGATPLLEHRTEDLFWDPDVGKTWPKKIRWEVQGFGVSGEPAGWGEAEVELSSSSP